MGPFTYARHLVSGARLPFTAAYFGSIALTLYFAVGVSCVSCILICLFCFIIGCHSDRTAALLRLLTYYDPHAPGGWSTAKYHTFSSKTASPSHGHLYLFASLVFPCAIIRYSMHAQSASSPQHDIIGAQPIIPALRVWRRGAHLGRLSAAITILPFSERR